MKRKRKKEFDKSVAKPVTIKDSRFGIRKMFFNDNEKPSYTSYGSPGRGANGESLS